MIEKIKKIELHVHLDGSMSLELASKLSGLSKKEVKSLMTTKEEDSLTEYLTKFDFPVSLMQTAENLEYAARDIIKQFERDNVVYAEVRFAPIKHTAKGLSLNEVIESVLKGLKSDKVKTNLIICLMKNDSYEDNLKVFNTAKKYLNKGVVAFDFAGDELNYPLNTYIDLVKLIKRENIPLTVHAGEVTERDILELVDLNIKRIGHGVKSITSQDMINKIKEKNILLEVCPTSNINTNAYSSYSKHPIKYLYDSNVNISINTDNRTVSRINLNDEYKRLVKTFNFTEEDFININKKVIDYTFLSSSEKIELLEKFNINNK